MAKSKQIIEKTKDNKVRVRYVEPAAEIRNKKNVVVGTRDITYDAVYNNEAIATKLFKEKVSEHKKNIKQFEEFNKDELKTIEEAQSRIQLNTMSIEAAKGLIKKTEEIVEEIKNLK